VPGGPSLVVWEVTRDCPLDCLYCYNVWKSPYADRVPEPPPRSIDIAAAIGAARPAAVTLTGGEPLLHPELPRIISLLAGHGILVGVATSGQLLDRPGADELVQAGAGRIEISLPSVDRDGYRRLTGTDGFSAAGKAMLAAVASGARLTVSHVMTAFDPGGADRVIELAFALGAEAVALNRFVPGGEGLLHLQELRLSREALRYALSLANEAALRFPVPVYVTIPVEDCLFPHADYPGLRFCSCVCGSEKWAVDPWGRVRVCEQSPSVLGSLLEAPFSELASNPAVEVFRNTWKKDVCRSGAGCRQCDGGCRFLPGMHQPLNSGRKPVDRGTVCASADGLRGLPQRNLKS
jgi:radical SAM protein with 4Fe4S-binding SPASM domain